MSKKQLSLSHGGLDRRAGQSDVGLDATPTDPDQPGVLNPSACLLKPRVGSDPKAEHNVARALGMVRASWLGQKIKKGS